MNTVPTYDAYSYGFSNRPWEATTAILSAHQIERLVDIRTLPGSRHAPQFNLEHLQVELPKIGVEYVHMKPLGGLRKPLRGSLANAGWRNDSFRGYADYMQTPDFADALGRLIVLFGEKRTAFACTEAVFWRCHRQLVSDALTIRGFSIGHIFDPQKVQLHQLTKIAKVNGNQITYP